MTERLLNAGEVAELLAVPESWVREHTRNGTLPRIQLGRYIRYRREAILVWLESQEAPEAKPSGGAARSRIQRGLTGPRTTTTTTAREAA
jgi:excisionase family DNA binding protein